MSVNSRELSRPSQNSVTTTACALGLCALLLSACAGSGTINWEQARQLKVGMTEVDLIWTLGQPYSVVSKSDGADVDLGECCRIRWCRALIRSGAGRKSDPGSDNS